MNLFALIGKIFTPAAALIDNLHTSEEEKLIQKVALMTLQVNMLEHVIEYSEEELKQKASVVMAEAQSDSWITKNWRPVTMLAFVGAVLGYWFGLTPDTLTPEAVDSMFTLVQLGVGGYVAGRSIEKTAAVVIGALKEKEEV